MIRSAALLVLFLAAAPQEDLSRRIEEILPCLSEDALDAREAAVRALADLGPAALPLLRARAQQLKGEVRDRLLEAVLVIESRDTLSRHLPALRRVSLDLQNRPAREGFEEIGRQVGLAVEIPEGQVMMSVSLSLKDALPLEAFDRLAAAAGATWRSESQFPGFRLRRIPAPAASGPKITVYAQKPPPYPSCWVRHYRVHVQQITLTRTQSFQNSTQQANLVLGLAWLPDVRPDRIASCKVSEVADDKGRSLMPDADPNPVARHYGRRGGYGGTHTENVPLKFPEPDASSISVLRGTAVIAYPKETSVLVFTHPLEAKDAVRELEGATVTLREFKLVDKQYVLSIETRGRLAEGGSDDRQAFSYEDVEVIAGNGDRLPNHGMSGSGNGDAQSWEIRYPAENVDTVKEIRIPIVLKRHHDEVAFEIKDIPLPR